MFVRKSLKVTLFRRALVLLAIAGLLLAIAPGAYANTRTGGGGDLPCYARIGREEIYHTDEWAAIVFYRPPEYVPGDFNLLDLYDFGALGQPTTTDGFIVWDAEPWVSAPIQINLHGLGAVPVWFVRWSELQGAIADDTLTITELGALESLRIGSASFYEETVHPDGGARVPMIEFVARGMLGDGQSFQVHATLVTVGVTNVRIAFR